MLVVLAAVDARWAEMLVVLEAVDTIVSAVVAVFAVADAVMSANVAEHDALAAVFAVANAVRPSLLEVQSGLPEALVDLSKSLVVSSEARVSFLD